MGCFRGLPRPCFGLVDMIVMLAVAMDRQRRMVYGDQSSLHLGSKRAKIRCMRAALIRSSTML